MAGNSSRPAVVLMADDDPDDIMVVRRALEECKCNIEFHSVEDGEEAIEYLLGYGGYAAPGAAPRPSLVLLDINMPRKDGIQTLHEIRNNPQIRDIPVVVLTTSRDKDMIFRIYRLGGSSFLTKPTDYRDMVKAMDRLCAYWFDTISLPQRESGSTFTRKPGVDMSRTLYSQ